MYQIFTDSAPEGNISHPPIFDLIKRTYQKETNKVMNYFHDSNFYIKSNHILCRLIETASIPMDYEIDRYISVAITRAPYLANYFNFTNPLKSGKIHNGIFYGEDNLEIIISNNEYFNPFAVINNWKDIQAIKVIEHNKTDLGLQIANGNLNSTDKGLSVFVIDIPLLLFQYRCFLYDQYTNMTKLDIPHFVVKYVIPNMLPSHLDIVVINRLINLFRVAPMGETLNKLPFYISDYSNMIDKALKTTIEKLSNRHILYNNSLSNIPSIFNTSAKESLTMPNITPTRQVWWALLLSRLRFIRFLIELGGDEGLRTNRGLINQIKIYIDRINKQEILKSMFSKDMLYNINDDITFILKI